MSEVRDPAPVAPDCPECQKPMELEDQFMFDDAIDMDDPRYARLRASGIDLQGWWTLYVCVPCRIMEGRPDG